MIKHGTHNLRRVAGPIEVEHQTVLQHHKLRAQREQLPRVQGSSFKV